MMRGVALLAIASLGEAVPRQLQTGTPDKCSSDASFQGWTAAVNAACCTGAATDCANGLPTSCDQECANVLSPFKRYCKSQLQAANMMQAVNTAYRTCPHTPKNSQGCPKNIPAIPNAVSSCGTGSGFWPEGSACEVTCAAPGGGHRRAQAGGASEYLCTAGGDWISANPVHCHATPRPPPPPTGPTRFTVVPQAMDVVQAVNYCRQTGGSLASIHSIDEHRQAADACMAACCAASTDEPCDDGSSGCGMDQCLSTYGCGCWIGFEDSASEGGFVWTDGSVVDFVNWAPGEPNGGTDESAVTIDCGRGNGEACQWNDDSRTGERVASQKFPICQSEIPQSSTVGQHVWGTGAVTSFNIRLCLSSGSYLFVQDDRLWMQYGGNWNPVGASSCPEDYRGLAYVNDEPWDISSLQACQRGSTCPVSSVFTDEYFSIPMGCGSVQITAQLNSGEGTVTVQQPTQTNGMKAELLLANPNGGGPTIQDITVTATCQGSGPHQQARLSCTHDAGQGRCSMGRIEVFNPNVDRPGSPQHGAWGTVCGHYTWDSNDYANTVCGQLGFQSGELYTFGSTSSLPVLPIVAGWRQCHGGESSIFGCDQMMIGQNGDNPHPLADPECREGCVGTDGVQGTRDDSVDPSCGHHIDLGAMCYTERSPSQVAVEVCGISRGGAWDNADQEVVFGCIDYFTTQCSYDATGSSSNAGSGTYMWAMRQFARCASVEPEPQGYCRGALRSAEKLANHDVCVNGQTTNIGYHIRMPFRVNSAGNYAFRMHADYGRGSYMGVDGASYTPGELWGHVNVDATSLTLGDHEFEVLGFENCCDGHAELEIHLPCDTVDSPWRTVVEGNSECLTCQEGDIAETCSMDTDSAACCGAAGGHVLCGPMPEDGVCPANPTLGDPPVSAQDAVGRFVAGPQSMNLADARTYCQTHFAGLASIHSPKEQQHARTACQKVADPDQTEVDGVPTPYGCWIGFNDEQTEGGFVWLDGSAVDYVEWAAGEPNSYSGDGSDFGVEMDFRNSISRNGGWNDAPSSPDYGMFPLCNVVGAPAPAIGASTVWGTGQTASFELSVCIDHVDTLFFQDDRLWMMYGGQYSAAGTHGSCPDRYVGRAYVNNVEWDISGLSSCSSGSECPVSKTFTDPRFRVPMGCSNMDMQVSMAAGRGQQPQKVVPSAANAFRGEVILTDEGFGGADVYDVTVTLTCLGAAASQPVIPARLSCTHVTGTDSSITSTPCSMGRMEVFNPTARHPDGTQGTWGTVCGHYVWDSDAAADIVCRQLGFASGQVYTFGRSQLLPTLPIVTGYKQCTGSESSILICPSAAVCSDPNSGVCTDPNCQHGCRGPDNVVGTADDSIDHTCTHAIDQGAICTREGSSNTIAQCRQVAGAGVSTFGNSDQPAVFGCVEYYTTHMGGACSTYNINTDNIDGGVGSYMDAMRAFAACAAVEPEPAGYCHGALNDASTLANKEVCSSGLPDDPSTPDTDESAGANADIGFHIRIPFRVNAAGLYTFRHHVDAGLGMYMGVDGPIWRPMTGWGHVESDGAYMPVGEHEWEFLGFEDCCDGHAELEVHLPCDNTQSPWRIVTAGVTACLSCDAQIEASCSSDRGAASTCRQEVTGCNTWEQGCVPVNQMVCTNPSEPAGIPTAAHVGRFVAVGTTMSYNDAVDYCEQHYRAIASIHSWEEQQQAASACLGYADAFEENVANADGTEANAKYGCWIGFQDLGAEGGFVWMDGSSVHFVDWAPGEPNGVNDEGDEDAVELDFRQRLTRFGEWNDATMDQGYEMFPLCETSIPPAVPGEPMNWGTDVQASFRVRLCVDEADTLMYQDDRMWIQYGGQYSAAGQHSSCPDRYKGKAYVGNDIWDISGLSECQAGQNCPVSATYTDQSFEVPMGCQSISVSAIKTRGRGEVTTVAPSAGNSWTGSVHIEDDMAGQHGAAGFGGADVYDVRVTLTCVGGERSAPQTPVRLSCVHHGTTNCHMGRIEVFNQNTLHLTSTERGSWGTVCGHWYWDNNNMADVVCRQLGFATGEIYTFGHSSQLPTLPIVSGFRLCDGSESNVFACEPHGNPDDRDCEAGCVGADGLQGTLDDTVDGTCSHTIDQGAICQNADEVSLVALETCQGDGDWTMFHDRADADHSQPVVFGCIDYYTTECSYDAANTNLANGLGSYVEAMQAFAACADTAVQQPGYCHGSISSAAVLSNQAVCQNAVNTNIGFHVRIPFRVYMPGTYSFRLHADMGLGSFVGVDGTEFTPDDVWGHIELAAQSLAGGEHEFEYLGFEDCCDGGGGLEVHLPCDGTGSPWRVVTKGQSDCLSCGTVLSASCSAEDPGSYTCSDDFGGDDCTTDCGHDACCTLHPLWANCDTGTGTFHTGGADGTGR